MSVGELEHVYGRNAQVELRSVPAAARPRYNPPPASYSYGAEPQYADDQYEEDSIDLPVRRSPWLPIVVVLMLAVGGFFGYALYQRGVIPAHYLPASLGKYRIALQDAPPLRPTEPVASQILFSVPKTLPMLSSGDAPSAAASAEASTAGPSDPGVVTNPTDALSAEAAGKAKAAPAVTPRNPAARASEDEAATMRAIQRERAQTGAQANTPESSAYPELTQPPDQTPPGYIEAESP